MQRRRGQLELSKGIQEVAKDGIPGLLRKNFGRGIKPADLQISSSGKVVISSSRHPRVCRSTIPELSSQHLQHITS